MNMKCPNCGRAKLVHDTRDMPYTYKGESTVIPAVTGDYCPACDEAVLGLAESTRVSALMLAFNREVNAAIVDTIHCQRTQEARARPARSRRDFRRRRQRLLPLRERQDQAFAGTRQAAPGARQTP